MDYYGYGQGVEFSSIIGLTFNAIKQTDDAIFFRTTDGIVYRMYHHQDCCESVSIEDVNGNWEDLLNTPILEAREATGETCDGQDPDWADSDVEWTFYTLRTIKGSVDIRWFGTDRKS